MMTSSSLSDETKRCNFLVELLTRQALPATDS
jgi:hypothetical protein